MRKRYLKMRKLLRMMAVSTMGVYSLFGMNTSVDAIPVSYTHLDVYKRQIWGFMAYFIGGVPLSDILSWWHIFLE